MPINGTITVRPILGFNTTQIVANVKHQVNQYVGALSLSYAAIFGVCDLERAVLVSEGVLSIANISFPNVPLLRKGEFYTVGGIGTDGRTSFEKSYRKLFKIFQPVNIYLRYVFFV